jgi:hypothetical protein
MHNIILNKDKSETMLRKGDQLQKETYIFWSWIDDYITQRFRQIQSL